LIIFSLCFKLLEIKNVSQSTIEMFNVHQFHNIMKVSTFNYTFQPQNVMSWKLSNCDKFLCTLYHGNTPNYIWMNRNEVQTKNMFSPMIEITNKNNKLIAKATYWMVHWWTKVHSSAKKKRYARQTRTWQLSSPTF
jgi:hypothetical protein